jgi:phosphate transport system protein
MSRVGRLLVIGAAHVTTPPHYEESLRQGIGQIRNKVAEMAALAENALSRSLKALLERDRQTAYSVILRDQYIDECETELDRLCLEFLVRQQPVAGPLRFVYTTIKLNKELERIGDYAESIARQVLVVAALDRPPAFDRFQELGLLAIHMFHDAVHAFVTEDADLARRTMGIEDRADALRNRINAEVMELRARDQLPLEALTPLLTVARRFERVTDQSKNICEEVLYMCTGEVMKHRGMQQFRVLFVDDSCSRLAPMAEAVANRIEAPRFQFLAAGLAPTELDPRTLQHLSLRGFDPTKLSCRALDQIPEREFCSVVIALSPRAREVIPRPPTKTVGLYWPVPDPAAESGDPVAGLDAALQFLETHTRELVEAILGTKEERKDP